MSSGFGRPRIASGFGRPQIDSGFGRPQIASGFGRPQMASGFLKIKIKYFSSVFDNWASFIHEFMSPLITNEVVFVSETTEKLIYRIDNRNNDLYFYFKFYAQKNLTSAVELF